MRARSLPSQIVRTTDSLRADTPTGAADLRSAARIPPGRISGSFPGSSTEGQASMVRDSPCRRRRFENCYR